MDAAEDPAARPIWSRVANKIARSPKPTKDTFVLTQDEVAELEKTQPRSIASMEDIMHGDFCRQEVDRNEKIPYFSDTTVPYGLLCACAHFITAVKVDESIWRSLKARERLNLELTTPILGENIIAFDSDRNYGVYIVPKDKKQHFDILVAL